MRALGYVLLGFNLLATAGFAYLAVQDWKGRQEITAAGMRHQLMVVGLPLEGGPDQLPPRVQKGSDGYSDFAANEVPFRVEMAGGRYTETVSPELLYSYFSALGGAGGGGGEAGAVTAAAALGGSVPVTSQINEVKRVRGILRGAIDQSNDRVRLIQSLLLLQAESYEERAEILAIARAGNAGQLDGRLMAKFDQVINPPKATTTEDIAAVRPTAEDVGNEKKLPAGSTAEDRDKAREQDRANLRKRMAKGADVRAQAARDEAERRAKVAHLLVHLDREAAWQKRVAMVVGLKAYVRAVAAQVVRFGMMSTRVDRQMLDDDTAFLAEYDLAEALARQRTLMVLDMKDLRAKLEDQQTKDQDFVTQRQTQLNALAAQLRAIKAEVDALLQQQSATEQQLFQVQRAVGDTLDLIYRLEDELYKLERERFAAPPSRP
jgi:hypothetical protein